MACLGDGDKQPAEDFENFHKGEKPARIHTTHKHRRRRTCGRSGNGQKFQKEIQAVICVMYFMILVCFINIQTNGDFLRPVT